VSFGLVRTKVVAAHPKHFIKFALPIFIGFLAILVGQSTVAPPANASIFGTAYNVTAVLSGGSSYGEGNCGAGQVVVGVTMGWNPRTEGFVCVSLNSNLTVPAVASKNANYVYCPDGMAAVGMAFINSNGIRAGLLCKTPPGVSDAEFETQYVSRNNSPQNIDKPAGQAYFGGAAMRCNAGDIMVGYRVWSGAWLDGLAPRCAPFTKFTVTYNVNSGGGTAPATQQQSGPNASITLSSAYSGTRAGFTLSGWNTQANGLGTNYAAGATITPSANLILYARWTSTITYDGNTNTGGSAPSATTAVSSAASTTLASNSGTLVKAGASDTTGYVFSGWNTAADGSGTTFAAGLTTYTSTGDRTLYAQWNSTITYNGNSNTGGSAPAAFTVKSATTNSTLAAVGTLSRTNFTFSGWNTKSDGTGTRYAPGLTTYQSDGTRTLFAQWTQIPATLALASASDLGSSSTDKITSDNTPDITLASLISGATVTLTATPTSGTAVTCTFTASSTTGTCTFPTLLDGTYSITAVQSYNGGTSAASTALTNVVIDATRPTVTITARDASSSSIASGSTTNLKTTFTATITFSESVTGFQLAEVLKDAASTGWTLGSTLSGSGPTYTVTATNSSGVVSTAGLLLLTVAQDSAVDVAGNGNAATASAYSLAYVARVSFDLNGGLGTVPTALTQSTSGGSITLPGTTGFARGGFIFGGWATTSTGTVISNTYTPTADITLFAVWQIGITYLGNGNTGGSAPALEIPTRSGNSASGTISGNTGNLVNAGASDTTGFTFDGWNTAPDASGTAYAVGASVTISSSLTLYAQWKSVITYDGNTNTGGSIPTAINVYGYAQSTFPIVSGNPRLNARYEAVNYNTTTKVWVDSSGNGRNATETRGTPTLVTSSTGNGNTLGITAVKGGTTAGVTLANTALSAYTFCTVARYAGGNQGRIFDGRAGNWLTGFYSGLTGTAHHENWIAYPSPSISAGQIWRLNCDNHTQLRTDGIAQPIAGATSFTLPINMTINNYNGSGRELSDWEVAEVLVYEATLTTTQMQEVESYLKNRYGLTNVVTGNIGVSLSNNSGNLVKVDPTSNNSSTFMGWNTKADGTGTLYSGPTLAGLPRAYARYEAGNYNATTKIWADSSGNGRNTTETRGSPTFVTSATGNGNTKTIPAVKGGTSAGITLPNAQLSAFTFCSVARYAGTNQGRIFDNRVENWLTGFYSGYARLAHHNNWIAYQTSVAAGQKWQIACDYGANYRAQGLLRPVHGTGSTYIPANMTINNWNGTGREQSDWEVAEVILYNSTLTTDQMKQIEAFFKDRYGISEVIANEGTLNGYLSNGSRTLFAQWQSTITYDPNLSTGGAVPASTVGRTGSSVALGTPASTFVRTNFTFTGWNTAANGTGTSFTAGANYVLTGNVTLFARWGSSITYNGNSNTGGTVPANTVAASTANINLASNSGSLVRTNFVFAGWNTLANGTGTSYPEGSSYAPVGNVTLFAYWVPACVPTTTYVSGYIIQTFTGTGTCAWAVPGTVSAVDVLTVGGGASAGSGISNIYWPQGGGGGEVISRSNFSVAPNTSVVVTVGAGGAGTSTVGAAGNNGGSSAFSSVTARGGLTTNNTTTGNAGATGGASGNGNAGGSGGTNGTGCGSANCGTGGGGGAGAAGSGLNGGAGVDSSISGTSIGYGGGGAGGNGTSGSASHGGAVGYYASTSASATGIAAANRGGGGSRSVNGVAGAGGSGVVIIRYQALPAGAPTISSVTATSGQLSIAFTAPTSTGGAPITNYQYSLDGGSTWITPSPAVTTSPIVVTGVANGTTFPVRIRAVNTAGSGTASNQVSGTTPLSTPSITGVVAGNGGATVSVEKGSGGTPTSYTVTALDNNGLALSPAKTCTVTTPATSCVVSGLTNGTAYRFSAIANLNGASSASTTFANSVTPTAFTVTYDANGSGASVSKTTEVFTTGTPLLPPLPTRSGFNFTGWFSQASGGNLITASGVNYNPASSLTLYAQWTGITYSITYNGNGQTGGSVPTTGSYVNGSGTAYTIVGNTGSLVKTGYTFTSWVDGAGNTKSGDYNTAADLALFAKWEPVQYTITYNNNGGTGDPTETSKVYTFGTTAVTLSTFGQMARTGYSFIGWSLTTTGATISSPYIPTSNVTLYARWSGNTYSVVYNANGGSGSVATSSFTTGGPGITLPAAPGTKLGHSFGGWSETLGGSAISGTYSPTTDKTLFAIWTANPISINYSRGVIGTTTPTLTNFPSNSTSTIGTLINLSSNVDTSTVLSNINTTFIFTGWKDNISNSVYKGGDSYRVTDANVTFTAQWVAVYTVSYVLNGGTGAVPNDVTRTDQYVETLTTVEPTRIGYDFVNWKDQSGNVVSGPTFSVSANTYLLYAQWAIKNYTVTYTNGAAGVTGTIAPSSGEHGGLATLSSDSGFSYTNFKFVGWKIGSTIYSAGGSLVLTSNVTAEAQWTSTLFQLFYDLNGGSGTVPSPTTGNTSEQKTLPTSSGFSKSGYELLGWLGGDQTASPVTTYTIGANSVTLYAQWRLLPPAIPAAPTALAGEGSATVTIQPGSGGGPVDSYVVTASPTPASPAAATCTIFSPSTSCTFTGLTNGTSYTFTSTASNSTSTGTPTSSAASNAVVPASKPDVVTGVSATRSNGGAQVSFTAPANNGGASIVSYTVTASSGQTCTITPVFPNPLVCNVSGLTNGTAVTFTVRASNGAYTSDTSTASIAITPARAPDAPTTSATTSNPGEAVVTVTAPANDGGSAITSYTVTSSPGGFTCLITPPATSCTFTGLSDGVAYTFATSAANDVGTSSTGTASSAITPKNKPTPPTTITPAAGDAQATVTFSGATPRGAAITSYTIVASPGGASASGSSSPITLTGLTNGVAYTFEIVAINSIGTSETSTVSAAITPRQVIPVAAVYAAEPSGISAIGSVQTLDFNFEGAPTPTYTYQWQRCTDADTCTNISGATGATYTLVADDVGNQVRAVITGTNSSSSGTVYTASITTALTDEITGIPTGTMPTTGLEAVIGETFSVSTLGVGGAAPLVYTLTSGSLPAGLTLDAANGNITGTPTSAGTYPITITISDQKGKSSTLSFTITVPAPAPVTNPSTNNPTPVVEPPAPVCDSACQNRRDQLAKAAADKAAADAVAKAAADKAAADAAAKSKADTDARAASDRASAAAKAAADAAKIAVERAGAAAAAKAAADAAAATAAAQAKAAADAQAAANKAAAAAQAALKNSAASAAAKAAATAAANKAAADAQAAVRAAATAAQNAARARSAETNANKQVEIAINSLTSRTASAQATAEANTIAAAAKAAANEAAAAAATRATEARAVAAAAQKAAIDAAARIAIEQREAATAAAAAKAATEAAARASAEKIAATNAAKVATETLAKVLNEKATLAEAAANATDTKAREEIAKKIEEIETRLDEVEAAVEEAQDAAEEATAEYEEASEAAEEAQEVAAEEAQEAVEVKAEVATKTAAATKAAANATVAAKVATAAKAAAAKVPSKAVITKKPSTTTGKNSAKATVTGLKPGQKVKVTVNVRPKP
jgi:uncharacterized repeat protein (TIGR02543 family)